MGQKSFHRSNTFFPGDSVNQNWMLSILRMLSIPKKGLYFCFDNPSALHMEFREDLNISEEKFMNLYGWYSWPSIFLGFIGGYLLDNIFGLRFGTALACLFVVIGQVFLSMGKALETHYELRLNFCGGFELRVTRVSEAAKGAFLGIIELCYFGRFIFGCGGETLSVAQKGFIAQWFDQKSLNFVLGLQLSFARIG